MKKNGFTLIEILIAFAIVGLLAAIVIPGFEQAQKRSQESLRLEAEKDLTPEEQKDREAMRERAEIDRKLGEIRDFGNGIYYFPFVDDEFRNMVSTFLSMNTKLEVINSDGDVVKFGGHDSGYGVTIGHTVFFREKR